MSLEDVIKEVAGELENLVSTKTVIGDPVESAGKTIIPVTRVSFGFGSGGGEEKKNESQSGFGGGGGAGAKIEPVAFIVISEEGVSVHSISRKDSISTILEAVPGLFEEVKTVKERMGKNKKEESEKSTKAE
jgi:sporulation protein YtfJ